MSPLLSQNLGSHLFGAYRTFLDSARLISASLQTTPAEYNQLDDDNLKLLDCMT